MIEADCNCCKMSILTSAAKGLSVTVLYGLGYGIRSSNFV